MAFPIIDGHFWVERNGEIIDPYFKEYDFIKRVNRCVGKTIHLPASPLVQQVVLKKFKKVEDAHFFKAEDYALFLKEAKFGYCWHNAQMEVSKRGGNIVFGTMGWAKENGDIHYEFGGKDWTVAQFLK